MFLSSNKQLKSAGRTGLGFGVLGRRSRTHCAAPQGLHEQAEPLVVRAFGIAESASGPEHPNLAHCFGTLADLKKSLLPKLPCRNWEAFVVRATVQWPLCHNSPVTCGVVCRFSSARAEVIVPSPFSDAPAKRVVTCSMDDPSYRRFETHSSHHTRSSRVSTEKLTPST